MERDLFMPICGIVVIGRNEGDRLRTCLGSTMRTGVPVVYVDSGSVDGSVATARWLGCVVVELDPAMPFTAARARNEGFARLADEFGELRYVQFIDGDCELKAGWLECGAAYLDCTPEAVAVCGRVIERHPEASIYNRLCAIEWRMPVGEIRACGGIFMIRTAAFQAVNGFRPEVVAGEEGDLCLRLRDRGGKIIHLDADMVWHDTAMMTFGSWWKRSKRSGYAFAQGFALHGKVDDQHFARDYRSVWFWALGLPVASLALAWPSSGLSLALMGAFPLQMARIGLRQRRLGTLWKDAMLHGLFTVLFKFPALLGVLEYRSRRHGLQSADPYEYKRVRRSV
jgi:GT2 family glycosyltransferase